MRRMKRGQAAYGVAPFNYCFACTGSMLEKRKYFFLLNYFYILKSNHRMPVTREAHRLRLMRFALLTSILQSRTQVSFPFLNIDCVFPVRGFAVLPSTHETARLHRNFGRKLCECPAKPRSAYRIASENHSQMAIAARLNLSALHLRSSFA